MPLQTWQASERLEANIRRPLPYSPESWDAWKMKGDSGSVVQDKFHLVLNQDAFLFPDGSAIDVHLVKSFGLVMRMLATEVTLGEVGLGICEGGLGDIAGTLQVRFVDADHREVTHTWKKPDISAPSLRQ